MYAGKRKKKKKENEENIHKVTSHDYHVFQSKTKEAKEKSWLAANILHSMQ